MPKQVIADDQLIPLIKAGYNDMTIVKHFGKKPGSLYGPLKRLREKLGIPTPGRRGGADPFRKKKPTEVQMGRGVVTYKMSPEEIRERYGPPGLCATEKGGGEHQAESYLIEQATNRKEAAKCQKRK